VDSFKGLSVDVEFTVKADTLEVLLDEGCGDVRESEFVTVAGNEHRGFSVEPLYPAAFAVELWLDEETFTELLYPALGCWVGEHDSSAFGAS
jgi:hypothetical protein